MELRRGRHEHAALLGYADWAAFDAEVKMIGSGPAIARFNDELAADPLEAGERDLAVLLERARRDDPTVEWIDLANRSEENTSELQSLMRISDAVFWLKKKRQ